MNQGLGHIRQTRVVVSSEKLPTDRLILEGLDVSEGPLFNITEVAKVFFGRTAYWIRWLDREDAFYLDDEYVGGTRTQSGARSYDLSHIEKMAHALAQKNKINTQQLHNALMVVLLVAKIWNHISDE